MAPDRQPAPARGVRHGPRPWLVIFVVGLLLWLLTVAVTFSTRNANLIPTLVLLGSFLVPVTFVAWAFDRAGPDGVLTPQRLMAAFLAGGTLGVLGASVLESSLLRPSPWMWLGVGLIEEGVKIAALWLMAARLRPHRPRDGMVLGAAVGFGFAALESSGYALTALLTVKGLSLTDLVQTEILRGLLAPFGHGLWTAIAGGVLFAASARSGRLRLTGSVVAAWLGLSVLHALWDAMHAVAAALALLFTGTDWQWHLLETGYVPRPTSAQVGFITGLQWGGWLVVSLVALGWLRALARRSRPLDAAAGERTAPSWPGWGEP
ncbi:PrsW family intramembrane metalloprotease, partial [Streptomyces diastaticus]|uniref:PrsW family intramembrane metalloprotease n=1 Tax=Streptomyces diastaticus TaxID=1956 RepID=UPI00366373BE